MAEQEIGEYVCWRCTWYHEDKTKFIEEDTGKGTVLFCEMCHKKLFFQG